MPRRNQVSLSVRNALRRRRGRASSRRFVRGSGRQSLRHNFLVNIIENGTHSITASQLGIYTDRTSRPTLLHLRLVFHAATTTSTYPTVSVAVRDGAGETDARTPPILVGPTLQTRFLRIPRATDFDQYSSTNIVIYFNINNFPETGGSILEINGSISIQYGSQNIVPPSNLESAIPLVNLASNNYASRRSSISSGTGFQHIDA